MAADASAFDGRPCNRARFAGGVQRIILSLDRAFEMRAAFDGDGLVHDVTFDPRGCGQADFQPAYMPITRPLTTTSSARHSPLIVALSPMVRRCARMSPSSLPSI